MIDLENKTILITGGTGSFGKSFTKFLLEKTKIKKIIIFSRDEFKQFNMKKEFPDERLRFFIGDVRDLPRLDRAFNGVDIVIHAAALKQVPALEYNPFEAVKTNILGTQNIIEAAIDHRVGKVLLISTDKAVQPINLYGSTKLCAEKLVINGNSYSPDTTVFSVVRYGNVIGSRGSIIEHLLSRQKSQVQITDIEMTRFWINLDQACDLVVFALENMIGGEIFVPNIPSMKLIDLFNALAPEAAREIIGIRPGEKLHETLLTKEEAKHSVSFSDYFVILPEWRDEIFDRDRFTKYHERGKKLPPNFYFSSEANEKWLNREDFLKMIN